MKTFGDKVVRHLLVLTIRSKMIGGIVLNGLYKRFVVVVVCVSNLNENQLTSFNLTLLRLTSQLTTLYVDKSPLFLSCILGEGGSPAAFSVALGEINFG